MCFPWGPIDNNSELFHVMAWCQIYDKSFNCIVEKLKDTTLLFLILYFAMVY